MAVTIVHVAGCGDAADLPEAEAAPPTSQFDDKAAIESGGAPARGEDDEDDGAQAAESVTFPECQLDQELARCGQISIELKGRGSSCQLGPTASDLTRSPRSVRFDCDELARGPHGYDYDALGHITLTGDTCEALQRGGPHRVTLVLTCEPGTRQP